MGVKTAMKLSGPHRKAPDIPIVLFQLPVYKLSVCLKDSLEIDMEKIDVEI